MSFITLTVPPGAAPGSNVQFTDPATKQTFTVAVPQGAAPGSSFQVQVAAQQKRSDTDVAGDLAAGGARIALKATIATGKATFAAAKYAHEKGWDKKAASVAASAARVTGSALMAGGKTLFKEAASAQADGSAGSVKGVSVGAVPGNAFWVVVPPGVAPGQQVCVLAPTGQQVMVTVPEGAVAGTQFQCQLAG